MHFRSFLQNKTHFAHLNAASSSSAQKESFVLVGDKEGGKEGGPFSQASGAGSACLSAKINEESVGGTAADAICLMTLARRSAGQTTDGRTERARDAPARNLFRRCLVSHSWVIVRDGFDGWP